MRSSHRCTDTSAYLDKVHGVGPEDDGHQEEDDSSSTATRWPKHYRPVEDIQSNAYIHVCLCVCVCVHVCVCL